MLTLGLEQMWFVSEEYYHALTRTATSGCGKQPPQHPSVEAELASHTPRKIIDL
jgi:hypothetical protein